MLLDNVEIRDLSSVHKVAKAKREQHAGRQAMTPNQGGDKETPKQIFAEDPHDGCCGPMGCTPDGCSESHETNSRILVDAEGNGIVDMECGDGRMPKEWAERIEKAVNSCDSLRADLKKYGTHQNEYDGARLTKDWIGHKCPTRNCQWQYGVSGCVSKEKL